MAFIAFIDFIAFGRRGGATAVAAFIAFIAMARIQLASGRSTTLARGWLLPSARTNGSNISLKLQSDGFMHANGYGCVLTLPPLLLTLLLLLLLLLLQDDDGWSRLFRFSPDTVRRRLWPKWATSAAQGLRPKKAVSISISSRVVARTFLRRHSRK